MKMKLLLAYIAVNASEMPRTAQSTARNMSEKPDNVHALTQPLHSYNILVTHYSTTCQPSPNTW